MTWLQFIADIFKSLVSLAWPVAFVIAVWLFREKLTSLMPLLRLKYKDFDVSFRLDQAEKEAKDLKQIEAPEPTPEETDKFEKLVAVSPRAAILERRLELQEALERFAEAIGIPPRHSGMLQITRELRKNDLIDQATSALLDDLRAVGNSAAHDRRIEISKHDAERFGELADRLIKQLQISTGAAEALRQNLPAPLP